MYVYILSSRGRRLYIGVTSDLERRVAAHRAAPRSTHSGHYLTDRLVHAEVFASPAEAIAREKQLKGWLRRRKIALIESANPGWRDLSSELR